MHIPDNYLSPSTCAALGAAMVPVWTVAVRKVKQEVSKAKMPLMGIGAAFSFLIMMFNLPLPGGTTGHAVGGVLLAVLLGPWSACISVTVALLVQALLFGDGGILAFGANCFNMAFVMPFLGYFIYRFTRDRIRSQKGEYAAIAAGSYIGINAAALCTAIEFGIQPLLFKNSAGLFPYSPFPLSQALPALVIPHILVVGVIEAVFTVSVFAFISKVSPGTIYKGAGQKVKAVYGLIVALICLTPVGLLAAGTAWGEWGANEISSVASGGKALGYVPEGIKNGFNFKSLMPDYSLKGLPEFAGYVLSAIAGVAVLIIVFKVVATFRKDNTGNYNG